MSAFCRLKGKATATELATSPKLLTMSDCGNAAADYAYWLANGKDKIEIVPAMPVDSWFCSYKFRYIRFVIHIFRYEKIAAVVCFIDFSMLYLRLKPNLSPQGLLRYVEYLEKIKLRGIADSFFVEVTIGDSGGKDFCKIALIPSRLGACAQGMSFCYGEIKGSLKKASGKQEYIAVVNYAKAHNFIAKRRPRNGNSGFVCR